MGKVITLASMSLDGYIAKDDNTIGRLFDWLQNGEVQFTTCRPEVLCGPCLCVSFDVLHDNDDLSAQAFRDRIPDGQTIRGKMETIGVWQRISVGKRVSKRGNRRTRSLTNSPRLCQFLASKSAAFPGVWPDALEGFTIPGLTPQAPVLSPERIELYSRNQDHVFGVRGYVNSSPPRGLFIGESTHHRPPDLVYIFASFRRKPCRQVTRAARTCSSDRAGDYWREALAR
jgi:hypothetical protein